MIGKYTIAWDSLVACLLPGAFADSFFDSDGTGRDIIPTVGNTRAMGGAVVANEDPASASILSPFAAALADRITVTAGFAHTGTRSTLPDEEIRTVTSLFPSVSAVIPFKGISFLTGLYQEKAGRLTTTDIDTAYTLEIYDITYQKETSVHSVPILVSRAINPRLIMTSISNFGQTGPYRDYKANTLTMLAVGGQVAITGEENRPYKMGGWQAEYMAGIQGFQATLIALLWRDKDGPGQHIDLSIMDVISGNLEGATTEYPYLGMIRRRKANRFTYGHPVGGYECKDGYVVVIPGLGGMPSLALLLEQPELEQDSFFMDRYARQERWQEFDERYMHPYLKEHEKRDIYERAQELRMPFALISTMDELPGDHQLKHRQYFVDIDHPVAGKLTYPGAPFKMSETPWQTERAPLLGEHNEVIYGQRLGYSKEDLVKLRERNII